MRSSSNHHHESPTVQYLTAMYRSGSLLSPSGGSRMNLNLVTYKKYSDSVQAKSVLWSLCSSAPLSNKCQNPGTRVDLTPSYNQYNNLYKFLCLCVYSRFLSSILMKYVHTQAPVRLCTLIHPGVEDSTQRLPKAALWDPLGTLHQALTAPHSCRISPGAPSLLQAIRSPVQSRGPAMYMIM